MFCLGLIWRRFSSQLSEVFCFFWISCDASMQIWPNPFFLPTKNWFVSQHSNFSVEWTSVALINWKHTWGKKSISATLKSKFESSLWITAEDEAVFLFLRLCQRELQAHLVPNWKGKRDIWRHLKCRPFRHYLHRSLIPVLTSGSFKEANVSWLHERGGRFKEKVWWQGVTPLLGQS